MKSPCWKLCRRVREPRVITFISGAYWLVILGMGVVSIVQPPQSIAAELGPIRTELWGGLLLLGGILGYVGCSLLTTVWWRWVEHAGMWFASGGLLLYFVVVVTLHFTQGGSRLTQALSLLGLMVGLMLRWALAHWLYVHGPYSRTGRRNHADER